MNMTQLCVILRDSHSIIVTQINITANLSVPNPFWNKSRQTSMYAINAMRKEECKTEPNINIILKSLYYYSPHLFPLLSQKIAHRNTLSKAQYSFNTFTAFCTLNARFSCCKGKDKERNVKNQIQIDLWVELSW